MSQSAGKLLVTGEFERLSPGSHDLKVHEYGDLTDGCDSTGEPIGPNDLDSVDSESRGTTSYTSEGSRYSLTGSNTIFGRALVLYSKADESSSKGHITYGDSGDRIACCIIGRTDETEQTVTKTPATFENKSPRPSHLGPIIIPSEQTNTHVHQHILPKPPSPSQPIYGPLIPKP